MPKATRSSGVEVGTAGWFGGPRHSTRRQPCRLSAETSGNGLQPDQARPYIGSLGGGGTYPRPCVFHCSTITASLRHMRSPFQPPLQVREVI